MRASEYERRQRDLRRLLRRRKIRHFLITSLPNVRYLSGFTGSNGVLWVGPDETVFFTDGRYTAQSAREVAGCRILVVEQGPFMARVADTIRSARPRKVAFEPQSVSVTTYERLGKRFGKGIRLRPADDLVESLRVVKSRAETRAIRKAAGIADRAFEVFIGQLPRGITERAAQWRLLSILRDLGSGKPPFDPIVLFGPRAALPHGQPSDRSLRSGDWVLMDYGAGVDGYCSDFTRTVVKGRATSEMREVYEVVRRAQEAAVRQARPRVAARTLDAAARDIITDAGYGKEFSHGLGHGVGIEIHEAPRLARTIRRPLRAGMVVTIEPGIYMDGWGGIRIEDTVLITAKGSNRLTKAGTELLEV